MTITLRQKISYCATFKGIVYTRIVANPYLHILLNFIIPTKRDAIYLGDIKEINAIKKIVV